jgi:imidazolonepropionase-like amidohydrolase
MAKLKFATITFAACILILLSLFPSFSRADEAETVAMLALVGGRVVTQTSQGVVEGDILIRDGRIVAVGKGIKIPDDARRVDVRGMTVTPGLVDARSNLWLTAAAARESASDGRLNVLDGIDPFSEDWREVARQGVTAVYIQPSATGVLGGRGAVLRVAPVTSVEQLILLADAGAQASLGVGGQRATSRNRHAQYETIKRALDAAKKYGDQWKAYQDYQKKEREKKKSAKSGDDKKPADADADKKPTTTAKPPAKPPVKPTFSPAKDFLLKVIRREIPLRIEAHRADDVARALRLAKEQKIRIVIEGVSNPRGSLKDLLDSRVPMVLGPVIELEGQADYRRGRKDDWIVALARGDARWAIASFGAQPRSSRLLRTQAAAAVAAGVEPDDVLRAITRHAAEIVGAGDLLGSIVSGKRADLAVFAGDPLDPSTPTRMVISGGEITYEAEVEPVLALQGEALALPDDLPEVYIVKAAGVLLPGGQIKPAQILIENGRIGGIFELGETISQAKIFDLGVALVTPGLISAHVNLGQSLTAETDDPFTPEIRAADALDPAHRVLQRCRDAGFLTVAVAPGSANVVNGSVAVIRTGEVDAIWSEMASMKVTLTTSSRSANRYPGSLAGQVALLQKAFRGQAIETRLVLPPAVKKELMAERKRRVNAVRKGNQRVLIEASTRAEIRAALQLIDQFKLRATLLYPSELEPFVEDLLRLDVGVIVRPLKADDYDRYLDQIAAAARQGVAIAFGSNNPMECRLTASLAAAAGMPRQAALSALTETAAALVAAPSVAGRLVKGAPADFVVWNGTPLDLCRKPLSLIVGGRLVEPNNEN